ncbi:hypothetical protein PRZ48_005378 [Zasmidium cellare]|uniref:Uncharacterized protein n=1 Tax=Zasmidium cellare TaxID=395010 RepID=A0ABR0ESG1_ZASCE|nr:hypothetical protein PRZ48_005378 [Zasmidium cellare]
MSPMTVETESAFDTEQEAPAELRDNDDVSNDSGTLGGEQWQGGQGGQSKERVKQSIKPSTRSEKHQQKT